MFVYYQLLKIMKCTNSSTPNIWHNVWTSSEKYKMWKQNIGLNDAGGCYEFSLATTNLFVCLFETWNHVHVQKWKNLSKKILEKGFPQYETQVLSQINRTHTFRFVHRSAR